MSGRHTVLVTPSPLADGLCLAAQKDDFLPTSSFSFFDTFLPTPQSQNVKQKPLNKLSIRELVGTRPYSLKPAES